MGCARDREEARLTGRDFGEDTAQGRPPVERMNGESKATPDVRSFASIDHFIGLSAVSAAGLHRNEHQLVLKGVKEIRKSATETAKKSCKDAKRQGLTG